MDPATIGPLLLTPSLDASKSKTGGWSRRRSQPCQSSTQPAVCACPTSTGNPAVGSGVTLLQTDPNSPCARTCYWRAPDLTLTCRELSAIRVARNLEVCVDNSARAHLLPKTDAKTVVIQPGYQAGRRRQRGLGLWGVPSSCSCIYRLGGVISLVPRLPLPDPLLPFLH